MEKEIKYAGFWVRFVAFSLDLAVLSVTVMLLNLFFKTPSPDVSALMDTEGFPQFMVALKITLMPMILSNSIIFLGTVLYWMLMTYSFGATLGKMAMGIKVVREDLSPVTFKNVFVREFLVKDLLYTALFFISWLGYLWVMWDKKKQSWHDKIARTIVIRDDKAAEIVKEIVIQPVPEEKKEEHVVPIQEVQLTPQEILRQEEAPKQEEPSKLVEQLKQEPEKTEPVEQTETPKQPESPKQEIPKQELPKQEPPKSSEPTKKLTQF